MKKFCASLHTGVAYINIHTDRLTDRPTRQTDQTDRHVQFTCSLEERYGFRGYMQTQPSVLLNWYLYWKNDHLMHLQIEQKID